MKTSALRRFSARKSISLSCVAGGMFAALAASPASSNTITLSNIGDSGSVNGAIFTLIDEEIPTGTGVFNTFLRVQAEGSESQQRGYNTDGSVEFETKTDPHTHAIQLKDLDVDNGTYIFKLDTNEPNGGSKPEINLEQLQFFFTDDPNLVGYDLGTRSFGANATKVYDLDDPVGDPTPNNIVAFQEVNSGSGRADMSIALATSLFTDAGATLDSYLVLFVEFTDFEGGFEEIGILANMNPIPPGGDGIPSPVPLPAPLLLLLSALGGLGLLRWRRGSV